jgi:hypothetical protein
MENRREFLTKTASITAGAWGAMGARSVHAALKPEDVLEEQKLKPRGKFEEAVVPDTLDLAERARLSVNCLTHNVDPQDWYYVFQGFSFAPGSKGLSFADRTLDITGKNLRALPWMRTMCGSDQSLDRHYGMMKAMLSNVRDDGLLYYPTEGYRIKNTSYPAVNAMLALACENHHAFDGNARWLDWIELIGAGLHKIAIRVEDRAYYPPECTITPEGKWVWNTRGIATIPYDPPEEPYLDSQGLEGCVKFEQGYAMRALVRAYKYGPRQDLLDLLRRLTRFDLKLGLWENTTLEGYKGNEHGVFYGHFHGNTMPLLALLDIAELENDPWLKEFVREAYEHALRTGSARLGWFPSWFMPTKYERPESTGRVAEGCALGEMAELGVRLSDAGLGDYWDQVDAIIRNQLIEQQYCDLEQMRKISNGGAATRHLEDYLGGFASGSPIGKPLEIYGCCSANTPMGLYYAWHGITRFQDGVATVNLLLNRASSWMDVNSYLPYEGKVELLNKQAKTALVRIPMWVEIPKVKSFVDGKSTQSVQSGHYLVFDGLRKGATIRLEFPNPEFKDRCWLAGTSYEMTFRGSTVVDIKPGLKDPTLIPLYQRAQYKATAASLRKTQRFVAENILPLQ